jgi:TP901 family phage tail tape measure protein
MTDERLQVVISAEIGDLERNLKKAISEINSVTHSIDKGLNPTIASMQGIIKNVAGGVAVGFGIMGAASLKVSGDFESQLSSIKALTGASKDQIETTRRLALALGKDTAFSALEAAQGIEELLKAGISLEQIMGGAAKGALDLAAAGNVSVAESAEIASTALNAFRRDTLSVTDAADILAGTANASATDIGELRYALASVSSVASGIGLTFKDTNTALAAFANNGLKGSDAGTSLKTMLLSLQPVSEKQKETFNELGLNVGKSGNAFFDAQGKVKDLASIAEVLQTSLKGLTDQQRLAALETLFGTDAIRAANILYLEGSDGIKKLQKEMTKFTAAQVAAERLNNLWGALDRLQEVTKTLMIEAVSPLMPLLTQLATRFSDLLEGIDINAAIESMKSAFNGFQEAIQPFVDWYLPKLQERLQFIQDNKDAFVAAIVAMGVAMLATFVPAAIAAVTAALPLIAIIGAVGIAAFALKKAWDENFLGIQDRTKQAWEFLEPILQSLWTWLNDELPPILQSLSDTFINAWNSISGSLQRAWSFIKPIFDFMGSYINGFVIPVYQTMAAIIGAAFNSILNVAKIAWSGIIIAIKPAIDWIKANIIPVVQDVANRLNPIWSGIAAAAGSIWSVISFSFKAGMNAVIGLINQFINSINLALAGASNLATSVPGGKAITFRVPPVPKFRSGVENFEGGLAYVHKGEVLANLPKGTDVIPAKEVSAMGNNNSAGQGQTIVVQLGEETIFEKFIDYNNDRALLSNRRLLNI